MFYAFTKIMNFFFFSNCWEKSIFEISVLSNCEEFDNVNEESDPIPTISDAIEAAGSLLVFSKIMLTQVLSTQLQ